MLHSIALCLFLTAPPNGPEVKKLDPDTTETKRLDAERLLPVAAWNLDVVRVMDCIRNGVSADTKLNVDDPEDNIMLFY